MKVTTTQHDGRSTVNIQGDLLISTVGGLKAPLLAALGTGKAVELDLSAVRGCDTAGVQLLLMVRASARAKGTAFAIGATSASVQSASLQSGVVFEDLACFSVTEP